MGKMASPEPWSRDSMSGQHAVSSLLRPVSMLCMPVDVSLSYANVVLYDVLLTRLLLVVEVVVESVSQ